MKRKTKTAHKIIVIFCLFILSNIYGNFTVATAKENAVPPQGVRVTRQSSHCLRIQWKQVEGASGYVVYRKNPGKKHYKKVKTITKGKTVKWKDKKVKPGKTYTYVLKSYKKVNGKKVYSKYSDWVSAKADRRTDKKVNVGKVKLKKNLTLGIRMTGKCGAKLTPKKYKKGKGKKVITKKLRYRTNNTSIATVDKKGVVTAGINTGSCYIYVTAHNGMTAKMKVTVVDYAKPATFRYYDGRDKVINVLLNEYKAEVCNIASYFCKNRPRKNEDVYIQLSEEKNIIIKPSNYQFNEVADEISNLLEKFPTDIKIHVTEWYVDFCMDVKYDNGMTVSRIVSFSYDEDCLNLNSGVMESHWCYEVHVPD